MDGFIANYSVNGGHAASIKYCKQMQRLIVAAAFQRKCSFQALESFFASKYS